MKIAFIGLGTMGTPMAIRIAQETDCELSLYDIRPEQLAQVAGLGRPAESIADAITGADAIFSVLPADRHVRAVVDEIDPAAKAGQVYIDFSTIGAGTIEEIGARLATRGVQTLSAGMTKSIDGARTGTLTLFLGGSDQIPESAAKALEAMAADIRLVGSLGAAKALKLMNNMVVGCLDVAICEALALGRKLGLPYERTVEALIAQGADNWPLQHHIIKHVLPDDLGPGFFSTLFLIKDFTLCLELAEHEQLPVTLAGVASSYYRGTVAYGFGDDYHMIVVRWLEIAENLAGQADNQPTAIDSSAAAETIGRGVAALQALISYEALRVLASLGVTPLDAADHFESGSAGNDSLRQLVEHTTGGSPGPTPAGLVRDLSGVIALGAASYVPLTMFEVGRQLAVALGERYGHSTDFWDTLARLPVRSRTQAEQ